MKRPPVERVELGRSGLKVSRLAFGTGYLDAPVGAGARLLVEANALGINFWDTSDDYGTHPHVRRALREVGRDNVVIATKTYAATAVGARRSVTRALREMGVDAIDLFLLHAVDTVQELETKQAALEALVRARDAGLLRAVGVSSHSRAVLRRLLGLADVDVALVVVNRTGSWMKDATPRQMRPVIRQLYRSGRGVYGMKALGSGEITGARVSPALRWAFRFPWIHSLCIGMTSADELRANVALWHASRK